MRRLWSHSVLKKLIFALLALLCLTACGGQNTVTPSELPPLGQIPVTPGAQLSTTEVLNYVAQYAFEGGQTTTGKPPTLLMIKAMRGKAAEKWLATQITGDDRPVIYVRLYGPFLIPHLEAHEKKGAPPVPDVWEVFDATTGTIPVWGVYG